MPSLRDVVRDQLHIWTSPARISRHYWKWLVPVAVATGVAIGTDNRLADRLPSPEDPARVIGKQVSYGGALYTLGAFSGGTCVIGRLAGNDRLRETGRHGLEALGHTQAVVQVLKLATSRQRPDEEPAGRRGFWQGGSSFPSGHAASSFCRCYGLGAAVLRPKGRGNCSPCASGRS